MTLSAFADFATGEVAGNPEYSSMFDSATLTKMNQLKTFTNISTITTPVDYQTIAKLFGMDAEMAKLLFVYYNGMTDGYIPNRMTLTDFVTFLQSDVINQPMFDSYLNEDMKKQIGTLSQFTDKNQIQTQRTPTELAKKLGMDESLVKTIFDLYNAQDVTDKTMTLAQFTGFLQNDLMGDPLFADAFDDTMKQQLQFIGTLTEYAVSGRKLTSAQMAGMLGTSPEMTIQLYCMYLMQNDITFQQETEGMDQTQKLLLAAQKEVPIPAFTAFLVNDVITNEAYSGQFDEKTKAQLVQLNQLVQLAASNQELDAATLASTFGMNESMSTLVFRLYYGGDISGNGMSMVQIVDFILSDIAKDPVLESYLDKNTVAQLRTMQKMMYASIQDTQFTTNEMASLLNMDGSMLKLLFTYHDAQGGAENWRLSPQTVVNYLVDNKDTFSSMMGTDAFSQLTIAQKLMDGSVSGKAYSAKELAELVGIDSDPVRQLYLLYFSEHGDTSGWKISVQELVNFLNSDILPNPEYANMLPADTKELLSDAKVMIDAVVSEKQYNAEEAYHILGGLSDKLDKNTIDLLYLYYASQKHADPTWKLSVDQLFGHMTDSIVEDPLFSVFIDDEMRKEFSDIQKTLDDGINMLKSEKYSRLIIVTDLPTESAETTALISRIKDAGADFDSDYYLIGNSEMSYEMQQTFRDELKLITWLTAVAIFIIVMLSFRSAVIPLILVLLIQCSVFITVTVVGFQGYSIYFLALLIVECILMGACIDYGIVFTNYYREGRQSMTVREALIHAYKWSIHTIMTSGLIIVTVTGILGYTMNDPTSAQIIRTISIGATSALILILCILPGLLAAFDKIIIRRKVTKE